MNIVLNVRPSEQAELRFCRIHQPDMELALQALEMRVLLYAPRGESRHGYFGTAHIIDLVWDRRDPRFLILILSKVQLFDRPVAPSMIQDRGAQGYEFYRYSPGIRAISGDALAQIRSHITGDVGLQSGLSEHGQQPFTAIASEERKLEKREVMTRAKRLRLEVLREYGTVAASRACYLAPLTDGDRKSKSATSGQSPRAGPTTSGMPSLRSAPFIGPLTLDYSPFDPAARYFSEQTHLRT